MRLTVRPKQRAGTGRYIAEHKRLLWLALIMIGVCAIACATAIGVIYETGLDRERARLTNVAQSQAQLLEAIAHLGDSSDALTQILEEHRRLREQVIGKTAELLLAKRDGELIVFLTPARNSEVPPKPVTFGGPNAQPMTAALTGSWGTMIGKDYTGRRVMAAFAPVPSLGLGLIAKIDMAEINQQYMQAAVIATVVSSVAVLGAAWLFIWVGEPMVRRLRESEERYRNLVEAQPDPICQFLPDTTLTFVNSAYAEYYGREPNTLVGRRWVEFAAADSRPRFLDELDTLTPEHPERHEETLSTAADGEKRWHLCHIHAFFDHAGKMASLQSFATDISKRKLAEAQLAQQLGLMTAVMESAADAVFVVDSDEHLTFMNSAAERIFGWSKDELTGQKLHDMIHYRHADGRPFPASECPLSRINSQGEMIVGHEDVFFRKDGSPVQVACSNAPLLIEGRIAGCVQVLHDITNRKRTMEALRESEARLRRTVENAPFPVMVHAEDGEVVHVSQAWLTLTGYGRGEISTIAAWTERAYRERKEALRMDIAQLYALTQAVDEGEERVYTASGGTRVWTLSSAPLGRDERGRRLVVTMAADVTEGKEAERALRESEVRMRALLDASQDEILLLSTRGEVLAINKAAERRLSKWTGGFETVGALLDRILPPEQAQARMAIVRDVAETATLAHCDVPIRSRWFEFWYYPVIEAGRSVSEVAVYAREITQQKKSQADLGKLFQAVQQSPMSVVITDRNGNIEYVNPKFSEVTGYSLAEVIGQNPRVLKSGHTEQGYYVELWNVISNGGVWRGELLNKKKNGELFWELASIAPVKDGDVITNFVAVKEDITDRKQMEEQLRQSQKMQAVGQLTGGIAHDFNNLLAIVIGNLQLLQERLGGDDRAREYIEDALWSAKRGGELTHRLLAFARQQPLKPTVIDLNDVVRGMAELLRRTLGANISVEELLAPDLWKAVADRGELERALVNLAVNARDAMSNAGVLWLETRNAVLSEEYAEQYEEVTPGNYVLLAVTDSGCGMPPEIVQRVFEPFFTTKDVGKGSGLGLSMVYGFVKQSGGHVSIYSRVGHGTSVKLYLPRAASAPKALAVDESEALRESFGSKVVLVVEDETKLRKVAVKMLDRLGLECVQAETAEAALELLADTHVDVLFTDIELPGGMTGTDLADVACNQDANLKVLFTTGYAREAVLHDRWLQEGVPWLLKPYSHQDLARELKGLLGPTLH